MPEMSKHHFDPILVTSQGLKWDAVFVVIQRGVCNHWSVGQRDGGSYLTRV